MFTGIVTEVGLVEAVSLSPNEEGHGLTISAPATVADATVGDSIAVNGVCLTVTALLDGGFECHAVAETLDRTTLRFLSVGSLVNLERPMSAAGRFDGHVVQGHVDGVGTVAEVTEEGGAKRIRIAIPDELSRYVVEKGSIAIDGVSLTVTRVSGPGESGWFEVVLIPHTLANSGLGAVSASTKVNLEVDIFAKYVERMLEMKQ